MSIWNKVLIGLILVVSLVFFILSARALKTHEHWREQARSLEQELEQLRDAELVFQEGLDAPQVAAREEELQEIGPDAAQAVQQAKQELESMPPGARLGLRRLRLELHKLMTDRGRVWYRCRPQPHPDTAKTGAVAVLVRFPDPHQIAANTVLWAFDEAPIQNGGSYLGQFTVAGIGGQGNQQVQLQPAMNMLPPQLQRLQQSATRNGASWTLCEVMPVDSHEIFAGLNADQLKATLPERTVDEYVLDGQMMTVEDFKKRGLRGRLLAVDQNGEVIYVDPKTGTVVRVKSVDESGQPTWENEDGKEVQVTSVREKEVQKGEGKYVRQPRDYEELFQQHDLERTEWADKWQTANRNRTYVVDAHDDARRQVQYRQKERDQLEVDKKRYLGERDLAEAHLRAIGEKLVALRAAIEETIKTSQALAGQIAKIQQEATRIIDARSQRMARAGEAR